MGGRLAIDINETDDFSYVRLSGIIDEDNDLGELAQRITKGHVVINTADVDRINSCGVRDWVNWLGELEKKGAKCYFSECSPPIMAQVNLVNNFVGSGQIVSFYAPYFCATCDTDKMLLIEVSEAAQNTPFRAPTCRCDQCDHTMEFDDIENSYFVFLATVKNEPLVPVVADGIKRFSTDTDGKLRTRTMSMPMPVVTGVTSTPGTDTFASIGTTPSAREFKGLLTNSVSPDWGGAAETPVRQSVPGKMIALVIGLLTLAVGLLAYVVVRAL